MIDYRACRAGLGGVLILSPPDTPYILYAVRKVKLCRDDLRCLDSLNLMARLALIDGVCDLNRRLTTDPVVEVNTASHWRSNGRTEPLHAEHAHRRRLKRNATIDDLRTVRHTVHIVGRILLGGNEERYGSVLSTLSLRNHRLRFGGDWRRAAANLALAQAPDARREIVAVG